MMLMLARLFRPVPVALAGVRLALVLSAVLAPALVSGPLLAALASAARRATGA